jgi:hypothetical protein
MQPSLESTHAVYSLRRLHRPLYIANLVRRIPGLTRPTLDDRGAVGLQRVARGDHVIPSPEIDQIVERVTLGTFATASWSDDLRLFLMSRGRRVYRAAAGGRAQLRSQGVRAGELRSGSHTRAGE